MSTLDEFIDRSEWPAQVNVKDAGWIFDPDLVEGLPVWEWGDSSGVYTTRVCLEQENGTVLWQVWKGGRMLSERPTQMHGVKGALALITDWRLVGFDEREIRRVTVQKGGEQK